MRRTHGNGEFIRSGAFEVGGYEWRILYYPSGYDDEHDGHEAVLLQLQVAMTPMDPDVVLEASGSIAIGDGSSSVSESEGPWPISATGTPTTSQPKDVET